MIVLDISGKICSINDRYTATIIKGKPRLILSAKYRKHKKYISEHCIVPGFKVTKVMINVQTYLDIDSNIKILLDGLEAGGVFDNDRQILELVVKKTVNKRGAKDRIIVEVEG